MLSEKEIIIIERIIEIDNIEKRLSELVDYHKTRIRKINKIIREGKSAHEIYVKRTNNEIKRESEKLNKLHKLIQKGKKELDFISKEKASGFPWLAKAFSDYYYLLSQKEADILEMKTRSAPMAAQKIREYSEKIKTIEKKLRITTNVVNYYHSLFPFLEEFLDESDDDLLRQIIDKNIYDPIKEAYEIGIDPVRVFLSKEEYENLSSIERNQLALDRYRSKNKSKWEIGKEYERYIGYLFESQSYKVKYVGILEGFDDLGRDLICNKNNETLIIQCKCWSKHKTIHEKHINQLYGTVIKYIIDNPKEDVKAHFYTSTILSDRAKEFARYLSVKIAEDFPLQQYPSVKCNISQSSGEKYIIFHLISNMIEL